MSLVDVSAPFTVVLALAMALRWAADLVVLSLLASLLVLWVRAEDIYARAHGLKLLTTAISLGIGLSAALRAPEWKSGLLLAGLGLGAQVAGNSLWQIFSEMLRHSGIAPKQAGMADQAPSRGG